MRRRRRDLDKPQLGLDRARAGDHGQMASTDPNAANLDDRVIALELAAAQREIRRDLPDLVDIAERLIASIRRSVPFSWSTIRSRPGTA